MGVHDGHRERLKSRFLEHGIDSFNDLNALELLLFYAIPRRDTNVIAHALLDRFGGLSGVFEASVPELTDVPGVGENAALLLKLVPQMMKKYELSGEFVGDLIMGLMFSLFAVISELGARKRRDQG